MEEETGGERGCGRDEGAGVKARRVARGEGGVGGRTGGRRGRRGEEGEGGGGGGQDGVGGVGRMPWRQDAAIRRSVGARFWHDV